MTKLVCLDIDGTLLNEHGKISEATRNAVERLRHDGHTIVIASGRPYGDILRIISPLALLEDPRAYVIAYNGVVTFRLFPFTVLKKTMLAKDDVRRIASFLTPRGFKLHVFTEARVYLSADATEPLFPPDEEQKNLLRVDLATYDREDAVYKVLVLDDAARLDQVRSDLPETITDRYAVFKSWDRLLEFVHRDGTKGAALESLYRLLGFAREDVIAMGDEENDIAMIRVAGVGIAMGNAKPIVKAAASHQTLSNREDGVAVALERFVFMKEEGPRAI